MTGYDAERSAPASAQQASYTVVPRCRSSNCINSSRITRAVSMDDEELKKGFRLGLRQHTAHRAL